MGWGYYFAFLFAAINTLTVTYFLAIENYPALAVIFPSFEIYIIVICSIGIPLLVGIGYAHYKRTKARKAEVDILTETNPYMIRVLVNSELTMRLNLKIMERLINTSKDGKVSQKELEELETFHKEYLAIVSKRKFGYRPSDDKNDDWARLTKLLKEDNTL
tara:strand:+ start:1039 stop:1521 length:483 start_codon:yes stop_codon:yes gene_type:complete